MARRQWEQPWHRAGQCLVIYPARWSFSLNYSGTSALILSFQFPENTGIKCIYVLVQVLNFSNIVRNPPLFSSALLWLFAFIQSFEWTLPLILEAEVPTLTTFRLRLVQLPRKDKKLQQQTVFWKKPINLAAERRSPRIPTQSATQSISAVFHMLCHPSSVTLAFLRQSFVQSIKYLLPQINF